MCRTIKALLLGIALLLVTPSVSLAADCQFVLGFKSLRDLIGHDIVGECLDNEHYNVIGDSNQHTTGGLLAWRKADNWTAFTDGYRTWVNGPNGLQQRLNTERFEWEADYAAITGLAATSTLTRDALRNAELQTDLLHSRFGFNDALVRLKDGIYEDVFYYKSNGSILEHPRWIRMWDEHPFAFGDLNADGIEDAVVITGIWEGGNLVIKHLTALRNEGGVPVHVASVGLGDIGIDSMAISDGIVTLQTRQLGPDDAHCCPSQEVELTYRLTGNAWLLLGETIQTPTSSTAPEVIIWPWNRDIISPELMLELSLEKRGFNRNSFSFLFWRDALRTYAYSAYPMYIVYLDAIGGEVRDVGNTENWDKFVYAYLIDAAYRSEIHSVVGEYMRTAEYLGPILTTFLKGEIYGRLRDKVEFLSLIGTATWDELSVYVDGRNWQGECAGGCQNVRQGLADLALNYDIQALERLPNPWKN